jgi:flagellar hook protein FlgE
LANSLTALLIYQRAFEANSKSVTTSDDMLKTAIDLKK